MRALLLLAVMATPTYAGDARRFMPDSIQRPPLEYRHDADRPYRIEYVSEREMKKRCPTPNELAGCWHPLYGKIYIRKGLQTDTEARVLEHEIGHINGWKH